MSNQDERVEEFKRLLLLMDEEALHSWTQCLTNPQRRSQMREVGLDRIEEQYFINFLVRGTPECL